jgi:hypothetical protein
MSNVGKSNRTPGKHSALDRYLGKTAGVISAAFKNSRVFFIDCTAGDGQAEEFDRHTSPGIMIRHAEWLRGRGFSVDVLLYERAPKNASKLREMVGDRAKVFAESSENMQSIDWRKDDIVFVSNDPNTINDWALPKALANAPSLTTVFSTLGCNVGGLKRLPKDQRDIWYQHINVQMLLLKGWHDAMLCRLVGDASQWAYLVNSPAKWREEVEKAFFNSFDKAGYWTAMTWAKKDQEAFDNEIDRLFLTKQEYQDK